MINVSLFVEPIVGFFTIEIGEDVYKKGISAGIEDSSWESLKRTKVFLKAPITTPQGGGFKSLNDGDVRPSEMRTLLRLLGLLLFRAYLIFV